MVVTATTVVRVVRLAGTAVWQGTAALRPLRVTGRRAPAVPGVGPADSGSVVRPVTALKAETAETAGTVVC
jgi:hypothetical protein